jgi:hypothetical protein
MNLPIEKSKHYPAITSLTIGEDTLIADLSDGRQISIPIAWFERLEAADEKTLKNFEISPSGYGIHWPDIDEDISVKAFIEGLD